MNELKDIQIQIVTTAHLKSKKRQLKGMAALGLDVDDKALKDSVYANLESSGKKIRMRIRMRMRRLQE